MLENDTSRPLEGIQVIFRTCLYTCKSGFEVQWVVSLKQVQHKTFPILLLTPNFCSHERQRGFHGSCLGYCSYGTTHWSWWDRGFHWYQQKTDLMHLVSLARHWWCVKAEGLVHTGKASPSHTWRCCSMYLVAWTSSDQIMIITVHTRLDWQELWLFIIFLLPRVLTLPLPFARLYNFWLTFRIQHLNVIWIYYGCRILSRKI